MFNYYDIGDFFYNYFLRYQIRIKNNLMNSMLSFFQLRDSFLAMQDLVFLFLSFNFFLVLQKHLIIVIYIHSFSIYDKQIQSKVIDFPNERFPAIDWCRSSQQYLEGLLIYLFMLSAMHGRL